MGMLSAKSASSDESQAADMPHKTAATRNRWNLYEQSTRTAVVLVTMPSASRVAEKRAMWWRCVLSE